RGDDELLVTQAPEDGCGSGEESGRPSWAPGFMSDVSGVPHNRFGRHRGHRGPSRGHRPNRRNPVEMVFSPSFKVDNVTFQNTTDVSLKEEYVKLIYNAMEPNMVSIEFGVLKP
ncbi:Histone lysine demethylase PHF8, partial [Dissostichus eleginoides]